MNCTKCGRENPEGSKYCSGCGQPFSQGFPAAKATTAVIAETAEQSKTTQAEKYAAEKKAKKRYAALICAVWAIALMALLALLISKCSTAGNAQDQSDKATSPTDMAASQSDTDGWSLWVDELPADITEEQFQIETRKLYRSSTKETTSSSQDTMEGWELSESAKGDGSFGPWSEWLPEAVSASDEREVETQIRYRYRDKETTTSGSAGMNGWTQYDVSYSWGDYGTWSEWSTNYVSSSDSRETDSKTQYRYRDMSYTTAYTDWGSWSAWQNAYVASDSLTEVDTRTAYHYYYFVCSSCGVHMHGYGTCYTWAGGCGANSVPNSSYTVISSTTPYSSAMDFYGTTVYYINSDNGRAFAYINPSSPHYVSPYAQYRYRTRSTYEEVNYGTWSNWGDTYYDCSSAREVENRTVYRYRDRSQLPTYHFYRWGAWSDWSSNAVSSNNDREVETTTFYRYRDREYAPVYYFTRWTDWSEWSTDVITSSDIVQVEEREQYRYKPK